MNLKLQSILAAVVALSLAVPGAAMADRRGHDGYKKGYSGGYSHKGYKNNYGGHHHYPKYRGRHSTKYYYYDDDSSEKLLIGLVTGGILGYALSNAQQPSGYDYNRYPQTANSYPPATGSSCLQEREYQTKVIVGGKQVDAYGTACLQPDGSWSRGPAVVASY